MPETNPNQRLILLVEDDLNYINAIKPSLETMGHRIEIVNNGEQAWNFLENNTVDVVLLDLVMPIKDGVWLLDKVRNSREYARLPVIVITSRKHSQQAGEAVVKGITRLYFKEDNNPQEIVNSILGIFQSGIEIL
jgi:CheY-like chemotaxis protein